MTDEERADAMKKAVDDARRQLQRERDEKYRKHPEYHPEYNPNTGKRE